MRFRTMILGSVVALIVLVVGVTSVVAARVVEQDARIDLDTELHRGALVLADLFDHRQTLFGAQAKVVSEEPRLKAVVATEDIDRATMLDVSNELRRAIDGDLLLLCDAQGRLVTDTADPSAHGFDLSDRPAVADALREGAGLGVWTADGRVYQIASRRLAFGQTVVGVLVVGWELGDELALAAARQVGGSVVILADGRPVASSLPPGTTGEALPVEGEAARGGPVTVAIDGRPHRGVVGRLGEDGRLQYLVLRSLDDALTTSHRLVRQIYAIGGSAVVVAILLALWLARWLARPLGSLVTFTRAIAEGQLEGRSSPPGPLEVELLGKAMNRMATDLLASREQLAAAEGLERELEIAHRIQTSILPIDPSITGYSMAASMETASEVGGDYYDVIPTESGGWIGIGDAAGHGLFAGLVMLMVQSATGALVRANPSGEPSVLLRQLNALLFDNIRVRLTRDEHLTFTLLRCSEDGEIVYAGAHEEIVVWRAKTQQCERCPTPGPWLAVLPDIGSASLEDRILRLEPGDLMLLYTDGVTEAMDPQGRQFGMDRLCACVEEHAREPIADVTGHLRARVEAWSHERVDDVTLLAVRYDGPQPHGETSLARHGAGSAARSS